MSIHHKYNHDPETEHCALCGSQEALHEWICDKCGGMTNWTNHPCEFIHNK